MGWKTIDIFSRSLLLTGLQTHRTSHRAAIQCFLLTTFCQLVDNVRFFLLTCLVIWSRVVWVVLCFCGISSQTVSLAELFAVLGCFRGKECLVYCSSSWREVGGSVASMCCGRSHCMITCRQGSGYADLLVRTLSTHSLLTQSVHCWRSLAAATWVSYCIQNSLPGVCYWQSMQRSALERSDLAGSNHFLSQKYPVTLLAGSFLLLLTASKKLYLPFLVLSWRWLVGQELVCTSPRRFCVGQWSCLYQHFSNFWQGSHSWTMLTVVSVCVFVWPCYWCTSSPMMLAMFVFSIVV